MEHAVPEAKIVSYLLTSPRKSGFFRPLGYSFENWTQLRDDLLNIAENFPPTFRRTTPHGEEYEIIGEVEAPNGKVIQLRTGWMIRDDEPGIMSFFTAYPVKN
jgi:hypothetical protein